jgi:penicillin-binding protein 1A
MKKLGRFFGFVGYVGLMAAALLLVVVGVMVTVSVTSLPRIPSELNQLIALPPTEVFAADGSLLTQVGGRQAVPLDRITQDYTNAVLAAEDDDFFQHAGVDKPALVKAILTAFSGDRSRGGSTITMQLARNLFFTFEKTYVRKFKEILATFEIERRFSKRDILNAYCNGVYFGNYAYGVEEAARAYFGKHAANLTLSEAALLAGLPQSPSRYNPYKNPHLAKWRQRWILRRMKQLGMINEQQYAGALEDSLEYRPLYAAADEGSYFLDAVLDEVQERYGETVLYHGGLKIYTTLDPAIQQHAVQAVQEGLDQLDEDLGLPPLDPDSARALRDSYPQAAMVAVESATGAVQALVGGRDWEASQFNRATQSKRNMGSVLKPVLYLAAMESLKVHPASLALDDTIHVEIPGTRDWKPENFERYFSGEMVLKYALAHSVNSIAARLIVMIQPQKMVQTLQRFGVHTPVLPHYSIALGGTSIAPAEMAAIGGSIANLGLVVEPYMIRRVEDGRGQVLEEHIIQRRSWFDNNQVYMLVDMMKGVIEEGTARSVERYGFTLPAIGKTGTTDDFRDSWFLGATPRLSACAWVGFDDNRPMLTTEEEGITGATGALPLWARFMTAATEGEPPRDFTVPPGINFEWVNPRTGVRARPRAPGAMEVALPETAQLPDRRLLELEEALGDTIRTGELDSLAAAEREEVLP